MSEPAIETEQLRVDRARGANAGSPYGLAVERTSRRGQGATTWNPSVVRPALASIPSAETATW